MAGNFFKDDLGSGYDLVFFAYNPGGKNPELVSKIHASLAKKETKLLAATGGQ